MVELVDYLVDGNREPFQHLLCVGDAVPEDLVLPYERACLTARTPFRLVFLSPAPAETAILVLLHTVLSLVSVFQPEDAESVLRCNGGRESLGLELTGFHCSAVRPVAGVLHELLEFCPKLSHLSFEQLAFLCKP